MTSSPNPVTDPAAHQHTGAATAGLTSPQQSEPNADIVIYDGDCNFCTQQVKRLARWDRGGRLAYVSLHDPFVAENYPDLTHQQLMDQMYLVTADGNRYGGADAFRYLSRKLPRLWFAAPLLHLPFSMPVWRWLYRLVARHRYRLAGRQSSCEGGSCEVHYRK